MVAQAVRPGKVSFRMSAPEGRHVSHTYTKNHIHIVFSTRAREKRISKETQPKLWRYMAGICRKTKIVALAIGGIEDHIHALVELPPTMAVSKAVNLMKSNSSRWMNEQGIKFAWQEGFGAFSVSASNIPAVKRYVMNQATHHKKMTFEEEFLAFLKKHNIQFDPKYVLD
jgi:putative transposase